MDFSGSETCTIHTAYATSAPQHASGAYNKLSLEATIRICVIISSYKENQIKLKTNLCEVGYPGANNFKSMRLNSFYEVSFLGHLQRE